MAKKVKMSMNTVLWYAVIVFGTINLIVAVAVLTRNLLKKKRCKSTKGIHIIMLYIQL